MELIRCSKYISLVVLVFLHASRLSAQENPNTVSHQFIISCDNNAFLLEDDDGYYTSGFFLKYDRTRERTERRAAKQIFSYELGHMIYNAHSRKILPRATAGFPGGVGEIDRPVTGYLFGRASRSLFYGKNRLLQLGISAGVIGKNAFGREIQESWHKVIGIKEHWNWVWDYQLESETGINVHGTYAFSLLNYETPSWVQVTSVTQASLGTIFTHVSQGLVLQVGKIRAMSSSSYWNSRTQNTATTDSRTVELFFFYKPQLTYQVYNATVQGGMTSDNKGFITSDIVPFLFAQDIGVRYSRAKYCLGYHVTFQSREAQSQFKSHVFANLFCAVRL